MSAIRPDLPAFGQPAAPSAGSAAREAQAAFFRAALGQTGSAATAPASQAPAPTARSEPSRTLTPQITPTTHSTAAADPDRPLRPGSLLDIRI